MTANLSTPRFTKNSQNTQISYELPHRIHDTKAYPIPSPNGSSIVLYAHETGVRIIWRGGRPFKTSQPAPTPNSKTNGSGAVISLDSDDESPAAVFEDKPEFEPEEEELDPVRPYTSTLQHVDLSFNVDVLHLAILPASVLKAEGPSWRNLKSLKNKLIFTAACADDTIRLVTLPLTPPSPASKARAELRNDFSTASAGKGKWGETVTILGSHQNTPSAGISMTADVVAGPNALVRAEANASTTEPHFVVASHSREVTGLLRLYRISIKSPQAHVDAFQSVYLSSPAKAISFNPSLSSRYASRLLVADSVGACRIYDYKILLKGNEESPDNTMAEQGTWVVSFHTGFQKAKSDSSSSLVAQNGFGRRAIIDAEWVSNGRAIIVLLDGEWAVWDIEGTGPNASQGILGRKGVVGGSKTEYSLSGFLETSSSKTRSSGPPQMPVSKFAPMTPGTRRTAEPFATRSFHGTTHGQISVVEIPSPSPTTSPEESVLFWYGDTYAIIPSLQQYWSAHKHGGNGNLFNGAANARIIRLENINLQGERCTGVEQIPRINPSTGPSAEVIILGEHRFTILSTNKQVKGPSASKPDNRLVLAETVSNGGGDLDVVGIDQALARMENNNTRRKIF